MTVVPPASGKKSFTCPHCGVLARHYHWGYRDQQNAPPVGETDGTFKQTEVRLSKCEHCSGLVVWRKDEMVSPDRGSAPAPNPEMPADVRNDYEEATRILNKSPRGAAALLRLAIQKLCIHLGGQGKNLNEDIKLLVEKGLPTQVQQALDVVRVTGNNAVHPGQIETDDIGVATNLFPLVNVIVEYMLDMPKRVAALYNQLPTDARTSIERRDKPKGGDA